MTLISLKTKMRLIFLVEFIRKFHWSKWWYLTCNNAPEEYLTAESFIER